MPDDSSDEVPVIVKVVESTGNFTIIIKVDGKEVQVSEFEAITHSEFLKHLAALTEAKLAEGLKQGNVSFDGNTVTLEFSTGMTSEWVDETPTPTPGQDDSGKDVDGSDATTGGKVEPHVLLGNKKAQAKAENVYGNNAATLPETGEKSNMGILADTAVLLAAGAFAVRKKKQD